MAGDPRAGARGRSRERLGLVMFSPFALTLWTILALGLFGLPIGHSMIVGSILYLVLTGLDLGTAAEQLLNGMYNSYVLLAVPLFLFAAELMNISNMTDRLLRFCDMLVGRFRGGLGHINIVQSIIFAGMSGSAIADVAGTGRISIDMMTRNNRYTVSYAAAITAASAVIGPIIPPSIPMVLYALVSDASIGYLFLGGVIPGLLMALAQMVINTIMAHRNNFPVEAPIPLREWPAVTIAALPALMMPVILLGGIYSGVMTPTEAAAVAALYAMLVAVLLYRNVSAAATYGAVVSSARSTAAIGMLIAGALVFNYVVTVENIPETVRKILAGYELGKYAFLLWVNIILLVLGCLLEGSTIILVVLPIFIPTAKALGIDLVHFGVVTVFNVMIGLVTPPYGLLLFIVSAISGAPLRDVIRDTMPFVLAMIVALAIITFVPETVLWLPKMLGYKG
jgi:C4-dicarboxylate transporter, DctM subunit